MTTSPGDNLPPTAPASRLSDYAAEATGFGVIEWRTFRDLLLRPRVLLDAYLERGPTAGGVYARPMGFYFALCGVLMFYLFLVDGMQGIVEQQPAAMLVEWTERSGKSREAFINDVDGWISLVAVPVLSAFYALFAAPFLKWWGGLDWRRTLRATFALLCAWTVPILFLGPLPFFEQFAALSSVVMWGALIAAFLRMGHNLWFTSWWAGVGKGVVLLIVTTLASWVGMIPALYIGLFGGVISN